MSGPGRESGAEGTITQRVAPANGKSPVRRAAAKPGPPSGCVPAKLPGRCWTHQRNAFDCLRALEGRAENAEAERDILHLERDTYRDHLREAEARVKELEDALREMLSWEDDLPDAAGLDIESAIDTLRGKP